MIKIKGKNDTYDLLSYCGLYCGACPSYDKGTCLGCRTENHYQPRKSKWSCKIRDCCIHKKEVLYCGDCSEFPCNIISKKLISSHPNDLRFNYRHEIPKNVRNISKEGFFSWIEKQKKKWQCTECGELITFYNYRCSVCNKIYNPKVMKFEEK